MFPLSSGFHGHIRTLWDKEWNKLGTLETKAFPIRDGNHVPLPLCNPLREFLAIKRRKYKVDTETRV